MVMVAHLIAEGEIAVQSQTHSARAVIVVEVGEYLNPLSVQVQGALQMVYMTWPARHTEGECWPEVDALPVE